jgi:hypothetical protein
VSISSRINCIGFGTPQKTSYNLLCESLPGAPLEHFDVETCELDFASTNTNAGRASSAVLARSCFIAVATIVAAAEPAAAVETPTDA